MKVKSNTVMRKINFHSLCLLVSTVLLFIVSSTACTELGRGDSQPKDTQSDSPRNSEAKDMTGYAQNSFRMEVSEDLASVLKQGTLRAHKPEVQAFMDKIGAVEIIPLFDEGEGAYRERRRRAGLHLWYDVVLSDDIERGISTRTLLRAIDEVQSLEGITYAEAIPVITLPKTNVVKVGKSATTRLRADGDKPSTIPNDPRFNDQWYLYNVGQESTFTPGFDINVLDAWKEETGANNIVVAVLDGGVQIDHPDLVDNIWTNPNPSKELNDLHGYNFSKEQSEITPDDHGTHVAGVIAATRNNGIGIAGVAGGDGTKGSGVRIMSCEIISDIANLRAAPNAFVYAADHGAVISNNSWGMGGGPDPDAIPRSYKVAIDYFIDNAGCDPVTGEQLPTSPMKGGVAIFSAGNDNKEYYYMPPAYKRVIAVGSNGPTGKRAIYSNHGEWVDISAPGGDYLFGNPSAFILSTIADDLYGYMQGTSMAAPLVTGVAALITSKFGGKGFTNEELMHRLLNSLRPYDIDEINPQYRGKLGVGYIDATKALAVDMQKLPEAVKAVKVDEGFDTLTLHFDAVADEDDGSALYYQLYYGDLKLTSPSKLLTDGASAKISAAKYNAGDKVEYTLTGLKLNQEYQLALVAIDRWGYRSNPIYLSSKTKANHKPIITGVKPVLLTNATPTQLNLLVQDPDGHDWSYQLRGDTHSVMSKRVDDSIELTFRRLKGIGKYTLLVAISDGFSETLVTVPYEVKSNEAPRVLQKPKPLYLRGNGSTVALSLDDYFEDPEGDQLTYTVKSFSPQLLEIDLKGAELKLTALLNGNAHIEVTATDPQGAYVRMPLSLSIVPDELVYKVYPIPCYDHFNIELSEVVNFARVRFETPTGYVVYRKAVTVRESGDRLLRVDTTDLPIGRYTLVVEANDKVYRKPFVKN